MSILIWIWSLPLKHPWSKFWPSILISKVQRTSMSKSWFVVLEDSGGSWLECRILILLFIWSLVFDIPIFGSFALSLDTLMLQILTPYFDFWGVKNIHVLQVICLYVTISLSCEVLFLFCLLTNWALVLIVQCTIQFYSVMHTNFTVFLFDNLYCQSLN